MCLKKAHFWCPKGPSCVVYILYLHRLLEQPHLYTRLLLIRFTAMISFNDIVNFIFSKTMTSIQIKVALKPLTLTTPFQNSQFSYEK